MRGGGERAATRKGEGTYRLWVRELSLLLAVFAAAPPYYAVSRFGAMRRVNNRNDSTPFSRFTGAKKKGKKKGKKGKKDRSKKKGKKGKKGAADDAEFLANYEVRKGEAPVLLRTQDTQ